MHVDNLLDLPTEILRNIYKYILLEYDAPQTLVTPQLKVANPHYLLASHGSNVNGDYHMPYYTNLASDHQHLGLARGTLSLLRTCSQIYQEAAPLLYSSYQFCSSSAESFRALFTKDIGVSNTKAIRKLCLGLPHCLKTMPSKYLG
jgi:hypothetical protein